MPNGDVLDVRVLCADARDGTPESIREAFLVGLELLPAVGELSTRAPIDGLPVVIDDEGSYLDVGLGKRL